MNYEVARFLGRSSFIIFSQLSISDYRKLPQIINEFAEETGMNPFKGF